MKTAKSHAMSEREMAAALRRAGYLVQGPLANKSRAVAHLQTPKAGPGGQRSQSRANSATRSDRAGSGKTGRPGEASNVARFAAFAAAWDSDEKRAAAMVTDTGGTRHAQRIYDHVPAGRGLRLHAMRMALAHGSKTEREIAAEEREAEKLARGAVRFHAEATGRRPAKVNINK